MSKLSEQQYMQDPTFYLEAFGCPTSQYEGEAVKSILEGKGFREITRGPADIYIINSCVVTEAAARKSRKAARRAKKENPNSLVVLMGCYPQVYLQDILSLLPQVELILGNEGRAKLPELLRRRLKERGAPSWNLVNDSLPSEPLEELFPDISYGRVRPAIKIQEGCDEYCRYCIVAWARGRPRSLSPQRVLDQAKGFLERGYREIILTGTHIGIYGRELRGWNLAKLIQHLNSLPYEFRIRLSSIEPVSVTGELLQSIAESQKVCPHLFLPLQSGSDRILKLMGRRYSVQNFRHIVIRARELMPDICIYSDLIIGFPGEEEEDHRQTMELVRELELSGLHVFSYSPRPHTPAYSFKEKVRPDIIKRRYQEARALHENLARLFHQRMADKVLRVLGERLTPKSGEGYSDNYIRVKFNAAEGKEINKNSKGKFIYVLPKEYFSWGIKAVICR